MTNGPFTSPSIRRRSVLSALGLASAGAAAAIAVPNRAAAAPPETFPPGPPPIPVNPRMRPDHPSSYTFEEHVVYPDDVFADTPQDAGVFDVKKLFGARGDGITDDTMAFVAAYDAVLSLYDANQNTPSRGSQNIIYIPNGTYLVSDTIIYTRALITNQNGQEQLARIRFQGESRSGVTIRLADSAPGYGPGSEKPVLSLAKGEQNGSVASNYVQNLTIDTGRGNPGAVGLLFAGANNAAVRQVTIRSGDGDGAVGLSLAIQVTQGSYSNLAIEGFDYAVSAGPPRGFSVALEHVFISGQRVAGIRVQNACVSVRDLVSTNTVTAAKVTDRDGLLVLVDSALWGGHRDDSAVEIDLGQALVRNVFTQGYGSAVRRDGVTAVDTGVVDEYVTTPAVALFAGAAPRTLDLPVEDTPYQPWTTDLTRWANVHDYGAVGDLSADDSAAIQAAMDSGHPVVYFAPGHSYRVAKPVRIPSTVRVVNLMYTHVVQNLADEVLPDSDPSTPYPPPTGAAVFSVAGDERDAPLLIQNLFGWIDGDELSPVVDHASTRTLVLRDVHHQHAPIYRNSVTGAKVFLDSVSCRTGMTSPHVGVPGFHFRGQRVWARFLDPEYGRPNLVNDGSVLWILGCKTEGAWTTYETTGAGRTEILGGMVNVFTGGFSITPDEPMVTNIGSDVSLTLGTYGFGNYYETLVAETQGSMTKVLDKDAVPRRWSAVHSVIPLYVGTAP